MAAAARQHVPAARRQPHQRLLPRAAGLQFPVIGQPARRRLPAGDHGQRHGRKGTGGFHLARGRVDPVHLRVQVAAEQLLRRRQEVLQHLGQVPFVPLEPLAVARVRGFDQHHARHVRGEAPGEQLRVQAAERMAYQQVRRRDVQRGEQFAHAVDDDRAGLRQARRAAGARAEAVEREHPASRLDARVEPAPAFQQHARAVEQHERRRPGAGQHVLERAGRRRLSELARQPPGDHRLLRRRRCPPSPCRCPRIPGRRRH